MPDPKDTTSTKVTNPPTPTPPVPPNPDSVAGTPRPIATTPVTPPPAAPPPSADTPAIKAKKVRKAELIKLIGDCIAEYEQASNIPLNHQYWGWQNELRGIEGELNRAFGPTLPGRR